MFCGPEIRRPKAEIRNQKSAGRAGGWTFSVFGLRISFGFRLSVLGFGMARTDFRAALPAQSPPRCPACTMSAVVLCKNMARRSVVAVCQSCRAARV